VEMLAKSRQSILPVTLQLNQPTDSSAHFLHFPQTLIELRSFDPSKSALPRDRHFEGAGGSQFFCPLSGLRYGQDGARDFCLDPGS
jgi:hypothetical protein